MSCNSLSALELISKYSGMREDFVQAGGGNTSVKESIEKMYIKSSGYQLTEVCKSEGFSVVNPKVIVDFFDSKPSENITKADGTKVLEEALIEGSRPSIETFLHSITDVVTIHTHPTVINILVSRKDGMQMLKQLIPEAVIVPYATPGIDLAKAYFRSWHESGAERVRVAFLQNHGLLVSAKTAEEAVQLHEEIISKAAGYLKIDYSAYANCTRIWNCLKEVGLKDVIVYLINDRQVYAAYEKLQKVWEFAVCPDCVVYCGKKVLSLRGNNIRSELESFIEAYGIPSVIFYEYQFYAIAPSIKKAKEVESLFAFSAQIAVENRKQKVNWLSDSEQDFLLNWDAEKYRKNLGGVQQ